MVHFMRQRFVVTVSLDFPMLWTEPNMLTS